MSFVSGPMENGDLLHERINLRGEIEGIRATISERLKTESEREKRLDERFQSQEKAIQKAEVRLDSTMKGFPQEYARKTEMEQMRIDLASTASTLAEKVNDSAVVLATAQDKVTERQDTRLSMLEKFQNKLLGIALAAPLLTGMAVYFLNKKQ